MLYYLEQDPNVMVIILDTQSKALQWLQYRSWAHTIQSKDLEQVLPCGTPNIPLDDRYVAVQVTAEIDLIDENHGWGMRETLDL